MKGIRGPIEEALEEDAAEETESRSGRPDAMRQRPRIEAKGTHRPRKEPRIIITQRDVHAQRIRPIWIYDNMIADTAGDIVNGGTVYLYDSANKFLGSAIYNENSRIQARVYSLNREPFDREYVHKAIRSAIERRQPIFDASDSYRIVFSEADFLPGIIADRIGNVISVQFLTLAADLQRTSILDALREQFSPQAIVIHRDSPVRAKEGLSLVAAEIEGNLSTPVRVEQDGMVSFCDPIEGQKTGLFLDQRFNRRLLEPWCSGKRVLDLFCYVGQWSFSTAKFGAREVIGVDSSERALEYARRGAEENGFTQITFSETDAFDYATNAATEGEQFDVVVLDPPAFAKTRKHVAEALKAYLSLNYRAMKMLPVGGVLVTNSCSQTVTHGEFIEMLETAARNARMQLQVVTQGAQPPDHPRLIGFPESEYLKCYVLRRVQ